MKTIKINAGFYKIKTESETLQIVAYNTDVKKSIFWMVQRINQLGNYTDLEIEFNTKKEAIEYIKNELYNNIKLKNK